MAEYLGQSVDALRAALQPTSTRGGQGDAQVTRLDTTDAAPVVEAMAPIRHAELALAGSDDLVRHVRVFADAVGLGDCVEPAPASPGGFRLAIASVQGTASPARRRAWYLLAGISGQVDAEAVPPVPLDQDFIFWLADSTDASATAFWDVLACLRRGRTTDRLGGANDPANTATEV